MKKLYFLFSFAMLSFLANAQEPFITTWEVQGTSDNDLTIWVPVAFNEDNNFTIDYGDGTVFTNIESTDYYTYSSPGIYTVTMSGDFHGLDFSMISNYLLSGKIKSIEQWGDIEWLDMEEAFTYCSNLTINATDAPNLSQVTNMTRMFRGCYSLNQSINNWDVSNITNMEGMFAEATSFNQPLDSWDVSNVISMQGMFWSASSFNQPLDNWNVSNVTDMSHMFRLTSFNQPLSSWDVSNVTDMSYMFIDNTSFNQPLSNWDVSNVIDMSYMFYGALAFNESLNDWMPSSVTNMNNMFTEATAFNQPINNWDVSNVMNMSKMFFKASAFNQPVNDWDVSNATNMNGMFWSATAFNQPLDNWNVLNVLDMYSMFFQADSFNQDLSNWHFNSNIILFGFVADSNLDSQNYDALLLRFAQLGLENKSLGATGLKYCDSAVRDYLINQLNWNISGDSYNFYCQNNSISGNIIFDENNNGCDIDDPKANNFLVTANDGNFTYSTISSNGEYNLSVMEGNYTIQLLNLPDYYTATPATATIEITGFGNEEELNFCLTANQTISDLNVTLLPLSEARPGFESQYRLVVQNMGTQTIADATATFGYNENIQEFLTASLPSSSTTANELTFNVGNIMPFESKSADITMQTFAPPTVNGNEVINFLASVTPDSNDYTPNDNTFTYDQTVVNSFDPNDKTVLQGSEIYMEQTDEYLDYIIRFQNTGTASAITVRIEDILHENLDWTTLTPISASHDYTVTITDENKVEFIFNNINLPHEEANEPGSHGFIAYKIKPVQDIQIGDMITGTAGIYFDYNLPIITNSADTEVVELLGVNDFAVKTIAVYPNPAKNIINIKPQGEVLIEAIKIYNLQGREIISLNGTHQTVDIQNLSNGVYFLSIETDKGLSRHKLIKN
ncbi:BspA family leucine-rich repeat surface protein [Flavobacterium alkalisoli]|uniref:BspA family leucine-rich repeat surface protein n=1 Tax=Flavobacterium alkalisoli TaxID=2602769 RepID=A0A5B9FWS7_9FLAO|nr:BspA family leucine-rich repeat surface protein [Flavobacterium alkalisoli]QEE49127.1 BspA family leucine-rich repeat surface protein [Flavobacterium alkalisoli]